MLVAEAAAATHKQILPHVVAPDLRSFGVKLNESLRQQHTATVVLREVAAPRGAKEGQGPHQSHMRRCQGKSAGLTKVRDAWLRITSFKRRSEKLSGGAPQDLK